MHIHDILYTPLDTPTVPVTDTEKLLEWVIKNTTKQEITNRLDASKVSEVAKTYPWNIIYPKHDNVWQHNFNIEFPELANFFHSAYGLKEEDIKTVVLLPVRSDFAGIGFWHSDPDQYGLRMYIENQAVENFLLIRPTVQPYNERPNFGVSQSFNDVPLQDITLNAKLYSANQTFFINNFRAVHAVNTVNPGTLRIAVIVGCSKTPELTAHIHDLVIKSAQKFKEFALLWPKP